MLELILIRHGETDWNRGRRVMGDRPIPLNDLGRAQLQALQGHFRETPLDHLYTSPVLRAKESAEIFAQERDILRHEEAALAEINYGSWVGKTFDEIRALPEFEDYHLRPSQLRAPAGESMQEVFDRVADFLRRMMTEHQGERIVAVSHADVIKLAIIQALNLPLDEMHRLRIDNGSYSVLSLHRKFSRALMINALVQLDGFFEKNSLFAQYNPFKGKS